MKIIQSVLVSFLVGVIIAPAYGTMILNNDDEFADRVNPTTSAGSKNVVSKFNNGAPERIPFFEFTFGSDPALSVTMNLYVDQSYAGISGYIYSKEMNFDQTTLNWNNTIGAQSADGYGYFSDWTEISPTPLTLGETDNNVNSTLKELGGSGTGWHNFNLTAWYNANLGKTMTIAFQSIGPLKGQEIRWRAQEYDDVVGGADMTSYLDVTLPEPASLILLALGALPMLRKRG